jgi:serine/threonine protein kinase/Flp pilus assembly protein TadD
MQRAGLEMIGSTISHYKILEKIGEGGMGVVYRAEDTKLKRIVALKFLPSHLLGKTEDKNRFLHEARANSSLNHPNIMTIYEVDEVQDQTFIAMEYIKGETLKEKVAGKSLTTKRTLTNASAIAEGLLAAHKQNIVHRDIKSDNIMLSVEGHIKIMDFGLAKRIGGEGITKIGTTLGTLAYMSPEQIEGLEVDHRSDIFSLGVVMYEMATGQLPFLGEHEAAVLYAIVNEVANPVSTLNPKIDLELARIIHKAIEKDVDQRYQNVGELLNELNNLNSALDTGLSTGKITGVPLPTKPGGKFSLKKSGVLIVTALIAILALFGVFYNNNQDSLAVIADTQNSLAILYFDNLRDPDDSDRLGQILQELIIADLSDIPQLKVYSSQRLFDIQKQLGSENRTKIDREFATEIAQRVGAKTMLIGNVIQTGSSVILTSQLVDPIDGSIIDSQKVQGEDIYTLVDELAVQIHNDLQLPTDEEDIVDVAVGDKTSSSVSAYQYYLDGVDQYNQSKFQDAVALFKEAVAIDSTFSQAYYKMALAQWWLQSESGDATLVEAKESLAAILSGRWYTSTKEKLMAQGAMALTEQRWDEATDIYLQLLSFIPDEKEAWYGLGEAYFHGSADYEKSAEAFEKVLELDPELTLAYRHIYDIYYYNKEFDTGIIRASQLVTLYPEDPWAYTFLGMMFSGKEEDDRALEVYKEIISIDPGFQSATKNIVHLYDKLGENDEGIEYADSLLILNPEQEWIYILKGTLQIRLGEYENALETFQDGLIIAPASIDLMVNIGYIHQLMGNYEAGLELASQIQTSANSNASTEASIGIQYAIYGETGQYQKILELRNQNLETLESVDEIANQYLNIAYIYYLMNDFETALDYLDRAKEQNPNTEIQLINFWIRSIIHAAAGNIEQLSVVSNEVAIFIKEKTSHPLFQYTPLLLTLNRHLMQSNLDSALITYRELTGLEDLTSRYYPALALLYLEKDDFEGALDIVNKMRSTNIPKDVRAYAYPRSFYIEGKMYEQQGNMEQAILSYERLMNIWQDGDEAIPERQYIIARIQAIQRVAD